MHDKYHNPLQIKLLDACEIQSVPRQFIDWHDFRVLVRTFGRLALVDVAVVDDQEYAKGQNNNHLTTELVPRYRFNEWLVSIRLHIWEVAHDVDADEDLHHDHRLVEIAARLLDRQLWVKTADKWAVPLRLLLTGVLVVLSFTRPIIVQVSLNSARIEVVGLDRVGLIGKIEESITVRGKVIERAPLRRILKNLICKFIRKGRLGWVQILFLEVDTILASDIAQITLLDRFSLVLWLIVQLKENVVCHHILAQRVRMSTFTKNMSMMSLIISTPSPLY
jgi:hypothetical protein